MYIYIYVLGPSPSAYYTTRRLQKCFGDEILPRYHQKNNGGTLGMEPF